MLWDLRQIRQELAGMKLDWEAPAFAPPPADAQAPPRPAPGSERPSNR